MKKFLIRLSGPMCSGKSTTTELISKKENIFIGSYDVTKKLIDNYSPQDIKQKGLVKQMVYDSVCVAIDSNLSIVIDGVSNDHKEKYKKLAQKYGYVYVSVNMEAPIEILEKRFLYRVETRKKSGKKYKTLQEFYEYYQRYINSNKDPEAITLDSNIFTPEQILQEIEKVINLSKNKC